MDTFIEVNNLTFRYPMQQQADAILQNISLTIKEGEFVAIVGANGSGKTTFIRHINGILSPESGKVLVGGLDTRIAKNLSQIRNWVGMVFQHPEDQIIAMTLEDDVAFGLENLGLPANVISLRIEQALRAVGLWEIRQRPPQFLSAGQIQRLALAGILAMQPRCIVFDEATSMLDPAGRKMVIEKVKQLNQEGMTILYVTHSMEEAAQANRVIVFNNGQVALDGPPVEVFRKEQKLEQYHLSLPPISIISNWFKKWLPDNTQKIYTIKEIINLLPDFSKERIVLDKPHPFEIKNLSNLFIEIHDLQHVYLEGTPMEQQSIKCVDLSAVEGRIQGLIGMTGSGKSTLLQHMNGLLRPQNGTVKVGMFLLNDPAVTTRSVTQKVGLVFQNPDLQFFEQYVGDEISFGPRQYKIKESLAERVKWALEQVGLDFLSIKDRFVFSLSGGEKRKIALASALALKPEILLLDEPMAGLDPLSRQEMAVLFRQFQLQGMNIVISSHYMEDMVELAQDLTVLLDGKSVCNGTVLEVLTRKDYLASIGLEAPFTVRLADELRKKGWPVSQNTMSLSQLFEEIQELLL